MINASPESSPNKSINEPIHTIPDSLDALSDVISGMVDPGTGGAEGVEVTLDGKVGHWSVVSVVQQV
jgi:hypothetical protein